MRILFAYDGSTGAQQARDLLAELDLPEGTAITAVSVLRPVTLDPTEAERHVLDALESELEGVSRGLAAPGRTVDRRVLRGRPADAILAEASRLDTELIVMGSRGQGPFTSALLGSVSSEVVDGSIRPVLVARGPSVRRLLLATDGTDTSALALEMVASWPMFASVEITVLSVSEPTWAWPPPDPATTLADLAEGEEAVADDRRAVHAELARAGGDMLRGAGRSATDEVRVGNPAHEIVQLAETIGADLIVTGSRRGSARLPGSIGSVARNVLHHATVSVLVVRHPMTAAAESAALEALSAAEGGSDPRM